MLVAVCCREASYAFWLRSASWLSFSTVVNCAVCERNCGGSVGLLGSWYLSCATRSLRNMSWSTVLRSVVVLVVLDEFDVPLVDDVPFVPQLTPPSGPTSAMWLSSRDAWMC